jgi:hypothetical protein
MPPASGELPLSLATLVESVEVTLPLALPPMTELTAVSRCS